jgi:hypothetical protein
MSNEGLIDLVVSFFAFWKIGDLIYISTILDFKAISRTDALPAFDIVGTGLTVLITKGIC